jgi:hypothetical protein
MKSMQGGTAGLANPMAAAQFGAMPALAGGMGAYGAGVATMGTTPGYGTATNITPQKQGTLLISTPYH